jgi:transcriptional regulator GlxA family with amidase domain
MRPLVKNSRTVSQKRHHPEETGMNTKLNHMQDWPALAREAQWSASALAKKCGVSLRTLERHFLKQTGKSPSNWMAEQRQKQAVELLRDGNTVKATASCLGYKQPANFTRQFKDHWGVCPSRQLFPAGPTVLKMTANSSK